MKTVQPAAPARVLARGPCWHSGLTSTLPLARRTSPAYDEDMYRWLLILLFVCQTGFPHSGTCRAGDVPQLAQSTCCRVAKQEQARSCCRTKVSQPVDQVQNSPGSTQSEGGDHRPCCGCCVNSAVYCLLPVSMIRGESLSCDRVSEECPALDGLTWPPRTPPPNLNGVG